MAILLKLKVEMATKQKNITKTFGYKTNIRTCIYNVYVKFVLALNSQNLMDLGVCLVAIKVI